MREDLSFKPHGSILANEEMEKSSRLRAKVCLALLIFGFTAVGVKLFFIQIVEHGTWVRRVDEQRKSSITIYPQRGTIYERSGRIPLATSIVQEILCVAPRQVTDLEALAVALSPYAEISASRIVEKIKNTKLHLIYLKRGLDLKTVEEIRGLHLDGVEFRSESKRHYPKDLLASNLIGFANMENKGLEGIEHQYDEQLAGEAGKQIVIKDNSRREMVSLEQTIKEANDGNDIVLTIDECIQYYTEKALDEIIREHSPENATAVVLDPKTGEVLAMACRPTFDPNRPSTYKRESLRNRAITDTFEPGSTFKPIAAAAALEHHVVTPEDRIYCELGSMRYHGHTFNDVHPQAEIPFKDVIAHSSNIGMIKVVSLLKQEQLYSCIRGFGFGDYSGIGLPGESAGLLRPPSSWSGLSMGSLPIGQELSVTTLQLASAFSAIANKGVLMRPYVVSTVRTPMGEIIEKNGPLAVRQAISSKTADELAAMLERVVTDGTGKAAYMEGYRCAGKTGTAQKANLATGGYLRGKYYSVFAGFVPVNDPVACIVVMVDSAKGKYYGGQVAAPAFQQIAQRILNKLEIPPTTIPEQTPPPRKTRRSRVIWADYKVPPTLGTAFDDTSRMPDMRGMTMKAILDSYSDRPLKFKFKGSGIAVRQEPSAGERILAGQYCYITFKEREAE